MSVVLRGLGGTVLFFGGIFATQAAVPAPPWISICFGLYVLSDVLLDTAGAS